MDLVAQLKQLLHMYPDTELTGAEGRSLLDRIKELERAGADLVGQFTQIAQTLNDINWPSSNSLATVRACHALRVMHNTLINYHQETERLRKLLNEALEIARIDTGKTEGELAALTRIAEEGGIES